jgi:hypothetical protein
MEEPLACILTSPANLLLNRIAPAFVDEREYPNWK